MKILYGGAFNPPTIAHYKIIQYLINKFSPEELVILPTNDFYKTNELISQADRIAMLEIIREKLGQNIIISDYELNMTRYMGTYYTLKHFSDYYFVLGADNLLKIEGWIKYPEVIIENKFLLIPRDNIDIEKIFSEKPLLKKYKENFIFLEDFGKISMSSSEYRNTKHKELLLDEINEYIEKNRIYKEK